MPEKYSVTVSSTVGGKVTTDKTEAVFGESVILSIQPDDGYLLSSFRINGSEVETEGNVYVIPGAIRDYEVFASFVRSDIVVTFDKGDPSAGRETCCLRRHFRKTARSRRSPRQAICGLAG